MSKKTKDSWCNNPLFRMPSCSVKSDSATPWTVARQAPLSMGFPRQEWLAIPFSRGPSGPRDRTWVSCVSCIGRQILYQPAPPGKPSLEWSGIIWQTSPSRWLPPALSPAATSLFLLSQGSPMTPERRQVSASHQRTGPGSQPSAIKHSPPRLHGWVCYIYIKEISATGKYCVTTLPSKKKKTTKSIMVLWFSTASAEENS